MSNRLRLSLLYCGILAVTLLAVGTALYAAQAQSSMTWLKQEIIINSNAISQTILQNLTSPKPSSSPAAPAETTETSSLPDASLTLSSDETFLHQSQQEIVRALDPSGKVIGNRIGSSPITLPLGDAALNTMRQQKDWWETVTINGTKLLIYSRPIIHGGRGLAILQVARALTERDQSLLNLSRTLVVATFAAILSTFGAGRLLAREAVSIL